MGAAILARVSPLRQLALRFLSALICAVLLIAGTVPGRADKRVALVIGNGTYAKADKLANPVTDAQRMRDALGKLGFEIVYGENLAMQPLQRTIGRFANAVQDADVALVYFAGHGATFGDVPYVVPTDAQFSSLGEVPYELVPVETLIGELRRAKGLRIAILDACRDDAAERELKRVAARGGEVTRGLGRVKNPEGLILAYATQYLSTAADGDASGDSPFTKALLSRIATPGLDVKDLFFEVGSDVIAATRGVQRPEISVSFYESYALVPATTGIAPRAPAAAPAPDPAEGAWNAVKDTDSAAELEAFIARYGDSLYGTFAKARLNDLRRREAARVPPGQQLAAVPTTTAQAALPARTPRPRAAGESCASLRGAGGTDLYCASSVLSPEFGNTYEVRNLFSSDDATAWVHGTHKIAIGQWIVVEFDGLRSVERITIRNGYQKSADLFSKNSRVRQLRLVFSQGESRLVSLQDRRGEQTITLDRSINAYWIEFIIEDVYRGSKYPDTAISKLSIMSDPVR